MHRAKFLARRLVILLSSMALAACASTPPTRPPVALASQVDLARFMGDWYVIANIPTIFERGAHNAKDTYRMDPDGTIPTVYSYNADAPEGPKKTLESRAFVLDPVNHAVWGQQYVWPFQADYRISYLSADYQQMVIARDKRDYVWIMARTPTIPEPEYARLVAFVGSQGYDVGKLQRVPQRPVEKPAN